ncbi:hypothetical protein [Carboxylicivirga sp. RSCT41]|uniref:hypothetical protein n=1 Tax=Carboxylicivirga agarovorans TaxID=3417570 RepID=UPI003D33CABA
MSKKENEGQVVPVTVKTEAESGRDPLRIMVEIATNKEISDADKTALILYAQRRFTNRRRMAYVALYTIIASLGLLFIAAFYDGLSNSKDGILKAVEDSQSLIIWIEGFLAAIVAAYYGVSAWRPAS